LVGVFAYLAPAFVTWPILDAVFTRYHAEPIVSASARSRLHWVVVVLIGMLIAMLIGAFSGC
jgi:hypothetical protein